MRSLHDRLITAYLARPTVAETFGAADPIDAASAANVAAECVDDSETAYESATRLADYLRFSGYNSAIVSINPIGRTSQRLQLHSTSTAPSSCFVSSTAKASRSCRPSTSRRRSRSSNRCGERATPSVRPGMGRPRWANVAGNQRNSPRPCAVLQLARSASPASHA